MNDIEKNNEIIIYNVISQNYELNSMFEFANKWLNYFESCSPTNYEERNFIKECEKLGFEMDSYESLKKISEEAVFNYEIFEKITESIFDTKILGNAILSKWRDLTHWTEEYSISDNNRKWLIIALKKLKVLSEKIK